MIIYFCLMMGNLLTTPMIYAAYSIIILRIYKATGHDLLPPKLLKLGSHILCYPLCFILHTCFTSGKFPDILKQAEICPIFKKGDAMNVCNYRPVRILPIVSKIYEKKNCSPIRQLRSPYISGFRKTHIVVAKQF